MSKTKANGSKANGHLAAHPTEPTLASAPAQPPVRIDPAQAAQRALIFLRRCTLTPAEWPDYSIAEQLLAVIANGQVMLTAADQQQPQAPAAGAPIDTLPAGAPLAQ